MTKAILVIDIPEELKKAYANCTIYEQGYPYRMWNRIAKLKPMPEKIDANDWNRMFSGDYKEREAKGYGYNACINALHSVIQD